mmetsp:Transcript_70449/g.206605  ORF Transcript_70449/g.206605 Transcript_70449/m.206605 type:complete len:339 (-) Transcript_70449:2-1018(-)
MVLGVAACDLLPGVLQLLRCHVTVLVLVCDLEHLLHGLLGVELAGLPELHLLQLDEAVAVRVKLLEVGLLLLGDRRVAYLLGQGVAGPELLRRELAVAVVVLRLHGVLRDNAEDALVRLRVEEVGELLDVELPVAGHVRELELLLLELLAGLRVLLVLLGPREGGCPQVLVFRLLVADGGGSVPLIHVLHELVHAEGAVLVRVHLIEDGADVLGGHLLPHRVGEGHHLRQGRLPVLVRVHLAVHGLDRLRRDGLLLVVPVLMVLLLGLAGGLLVVLLLVLGVVIIRSISRPASLGLNRRGAEERERERHSPDGTHGATLLPAGRGLRRENDKEQRPPP